MKTKFCELAVGARFTVASAPNVVYAKRPDGPKGGRAEAVEFDPAQNSWFVQSIKNVGAAIVCINRNAKVTVV